jgi:hypothetical protein
MPDEQIPQGQDPKESGDEDKPRNLMGVGIAVGIAIGTAIGNGMDNIGAGIAIGIAIGVGLGTEFNKAQAKE